MATNAKHFVLVHGACHGAWCWYKLKPQLEAAGHRVTALDLAASGINTTPIEQVKTLNDYSQPLTEFLASLPPGDEVILVGHSLGGMNLALAMDNFPKKISVAVFVTAFVPDTEHRPSYVLEKFIEEMKKMPEEAMERGAETEIFTPTYMRNNLYQKCSEEDLALGLMLVRPAPVLTKSLSKAEKFSAEGFGSVKKIFIACGEDNGIGIAFQRWMIENAGIKDVMEIKDADHMAMLSRPQELCACLLHIANKIKIM